MWNPFKKNKKTNQPVYINISGRKTLKDVVPGERVTIEWEHSKSGFANPVCLNNDPATKTILLEQTWVDFSTTPTTIVRTEKLVLKYDDYKFRNFYLLNTIPEALKKETSLEKEIEKIKLEINK